MTTLEKVIYGLELMRENLPKIKSNKDAVAYVLANYDKHLIILQAYGTERMIAYYTRWRDDFKKNKGGEQ